MFFSCRYKQEKLWGKHLKKLKDRKIRLQLETNNGKAQSDLFFNRLGIK